MKTAITVCFEDRGQDFLEFDIRGGRIVAARPFQNRIWSEMEVVNETISAGDYLLVRIGKQVRTINYPVASVHPLKGPVQIGPTDV